MHSYVYITYAHLVVLAVETGVMELITELGVCEYEVRSVDSNPAKFYENQLGM